MDNEASFDLRHYWVVVRRSLWKIIGLALTITLLAALFISSKTPIYSATATLLVESQEANVVAIEQVYGMPSRGWQYLATQFEILKSRPIAERVVRDMDLVSHPLYNREDEEPPLIDWRAWLPEGLVSEAEAPSPELRINGLVNGYMRSIEIAPVGGTQLVNVNFESPDPQLAAELANAHALAFIESALESKLSITQTAATWMGERMEALKTNLQESEARLQEFREREQVMDSGTLSALPAQEVNELSQRLGDARRELNISRSRYNQVRDLRNAESLDLEGIPAVLSDPLVTQLRNQRGSTEQLVAELGKRYGPKHPRMIAATSDLQGATENLSRAIRSVIDGIRQEYEIAESQVEQLELAIEGARDAFVKTGRKEGKLLELQREVETNRQLYNLFYNRVRETTETVDLANANARIIAPAVMSHTPIKPNKRRFILLALIASLGAGVGLVLLLDLMDNAIRSADDVTDKLGASLLGMVPLIDTGKLDRPLAQAFLSEDQPGFKEAIRTIRTGVSLDALDTPHQIIMVTSSVPGEGKSTVAGNLAIAFAQMGPTLLIDCDMRRPTVGKEFGLPRNQPGLAEVVAGSAKIEEAVASPFDDALKVMSAGVVPANPLELLASKRFAMLLQTLSERYDRIILDCPPSLAVSDASVISTHANTMVFVARSEKSVTRQVKNAFTTLNKVDAPLLGVVLNAVDTKRAERYDYGHGYYGNYYQTGTD